MNTAFFVLIGSDKQGPYNMEQLMQLQQKGQLTPDTPVWKEGMEQWSKAGDCRELSVIFVTPEIPVGEGKNTASAAGRKKLIPAIIAAGVIVAIGIAVFLLFIKTGENTDFSLIPVCNDGERWGYINRRGEYVINPQFEDADFFSGDGIAKIKSGGGKTGYINKKGEYLIPATYKGGTAYSDGLAFVVAEGGLPTCIDKKGNTIFVLSVAKYVSSFSEGLAIFITEGGDYGFVDKAGNIVVNAQFEHALPFYGGFARIWQKGDVGFIDKTGKHVITPQFKAIGNFSEEKAAFSNGQKWGYINKTGAYAINPQYDDAGKFSHGMAAIQQGKSYGYINKEGRLVVNPQFDKASAFSDDLAAVQSANRFGYINKDGKYEINTQFENAGDFYNGIALVQNADKWGLINKKGQYVVNPQFRNVKFETNHDVRLDFVENDYYDTSEFIKVFLEREAGSSFDGIKASTTLEELSNHPQYGADINARGNNYADCRQTIPITNEIVIGSVTFHFINTPIYKEVETTNTWGYRSTNRSLDFSATPDAVVYQFNLSGKANEKRSVVFNALKTEIERRQGQTMRMLDANRKVYLLNQDTGKLSFAVDENSGTLHVAFNEGYLSGIFR